MSNPIINLSASSIYISTNTIFSVGFHWSLFVTDENARATRHDWAQSGAIEKYRTKVIDPTKTYSSNNAVLVYLKVGGCSPPDANRMEEFCRSVFPGGSKPTVKENRQAGMTCRTWLLQVLKVLIEEGFVVRENGIEGIEDKVREISAAQEQKLAEGSFNFSFVGEV
jgi:hypothetical protein